MGLKRVSRRLISPRHLFFFFYSCLTLFRHRKRRRAGLQAAGVFIMLATHQFLVWLSPCPPTSFLLVFVHGDHLGNFNPTASQIFKMSSRCNAPVLLRLSARTGSSIFTPKLFLQEASVCFLKSVPASLPRYSRLSCLHGGIHKGCLGRLIHGSSSRDGQTNVPTPAERCNVGPRVEAEVFT